MRYTLALLPLLVACGSNRADDILALTGDAAAGETLFVEHCESCHGVGAIGGSGPMLAGDFEAEEARRLAALTPKPAPLFPLHPVTAYAAEDDVVVPLRPQVRRVEPYH